MTYLLMPGRQIVNTQFQERYLDEILGQDMSRLGDLLGTPPAGKVDEIVFAVTSCNKSNSRYNPLPFEVRSILVYEFARQLKVAHGVGFRIIGIPHYQPTDRFAAIVLKEIQEQTNGRVTLGPDNTVVYSCTPSMIEAYLGLGFAVLPGEYDPRSGSFTHPVPNDVVQQLGTGGLQRAAGLLSSSTLAVFRNFSEAVDRIYDLFHDPILTEQGDLTESRDYATYTREMAHVIGLKYQDIARFILPGKIIDEGCADGALIERIARDYPDSDIIGIDLSAEMLARANELKRSGAFGGAFVFFKQQNLMTPVSRAQENTADTIICNSTLHELWSYGEGASTVREYLRGKYRQLRRGGRLVIRDVVGPEAGDQWVYLRCAAEDGLDTPAFADHRPEELSTRSRFLRFAIDFKRGGFDFEVKRVEGKDLFLLRLRDAMEFITKMDYTDNWQSEMQEEFCFWSFSDWKRELTEAGFVVLPESHAYLNAWRVEHSFKKKVELLSPEMTPLPFPETNMVLVGEKIVDFAAEGTE